MLVSAKEMLTKAKAGHYAVGQFNINNLEWTKSILQTAQELESPVILGVSEGAGKYMCGYKTIVGMVKGMIEELNITVPVALHLDHGSFEGAKACINAGLCLMVPAFRSRRTYRRQQSLSTHVTFLVFLLRQRLVQSVAKKMVSSVPASVQILRSVRRLQILG